ncbi:glycosyltransferase [Pantoea sp. DY-15]|uniref:glycosyltransferase n=1 Tax=Pantoea sp. DY-15 TaxID=2871489 RepID=UPI001C95E17E|nr:glycosyltransferase [Pantoea sp. DY-15]MBY4891042.1 glycosyltransferase [Pantoea sp. DY-15]
MRRKILLLDTGREWGGGTNSMLELLKRIDRQRFDITCCFYNNYSRGNSETIESILNSIGIPVVFIAQRRQPKWAKIAKELLRTLFIFNRSLKKQMIDRVDEKWRVLPNAQQISSLLQAGQYDALYMNNQPSTNVEGYRAVEDLQVALIQHCRIEPQLNSVLVDMVNKRVDAVIAVSHGVNQTLRQSGIDAQRCFTVSNAIDIHQALPDREEVRERFAYSPDTFIFGSIGSLITRKANHHIFQALGQFKRIHPEANWKMVVVGAGPEQENLVLLARKENIASNIVFTGFQNNPMDYLAAFDTFILASSSEGLPRVVLEAMLVKTAVIGSNVVGTAELISHNETGLLFEYGDIKQLSAHLAVLWQDASLRQRLINTAEERVRECYAIENYVAGVETILDKSIKRKTHV